MNEIQTLGRKMALAGIESAEKFNAEVAALSQQDAIDLLAGVIDRQTRMEEYSSLCDAEKHSLHLVADWLQAQQSKEAK